MSLRHALLAILTADPMTGYDLVKYFDRTVAFVWNAPHSQIYPELRRMEQAGLIEGDVVQRGERAQKRVYRINEKGVLELERWANELLPLQPERDAARLKAAYFEWGSYEAARRQLTEHLNHYTDHLRQWEQAIDDINARRVALLKRRLDVRPADEHEAIVAFKAFAFRGEAARARSEIAWAEEGLKLLGALERNGVKFARQGAVGGSQPTVLRTRAGGR
jgi:PadR family transcriptional regulator, regulator of vanillate utilization